MELPKLIDQQVIFINLDINWIVSVQLVLDVHILLLCSESMMWV